MGSSFLYGYNYQSPVCVAFSENGYGHGAP